MGKVSGLGMAISVDKADGNPLDISNDCRGLTMNNSAGEFDVTGIDKSAMERLLGLGDFELTLSGVFNAAKSHLVFEDFRTIVAGQVGRTTDITLPGAIHLIVELVYSSYNVVRGEDGGLVWTATGRLSDGTVPVFS